MLLVQLPQIHTESHSNSYISQTPPDTLCFFFFTPGGLLGCAITLVPKPATPLNKRVDWNGITGKRQGMQCFSFANHFRFLFGMV